MEMKPKYDPREVEAGRYEEWVKMVILNHQKINRKIHILLLFAKCDGKITFRTCVDTTLQDILLV